MRLASQNLAFGGALPGQHYAILFDAIKYEPQVEAFGPRDVWLVNLESGAKKIIVEKLRGGYGEILLSPCGKYITYDKDGHWWVYDPNKDTHLNVTLKLPMPVYDVGNDQPDKSTLYGHPGWTKNDQALLVYDQFDIWEIAPNGDYRRRLTKGREKGIRFRIETLNAKQKV